MHLNKSGFTIVDPGSSAGLSGSIAKAYERGEAWFGYYWSPTAVLGKYDMVKVDFGSGVDEKEFVSCTTQTDCEAPKLTMYHLLRCTLLRPKNLPNGHLKPMSTSRREDSQTII